jgi:type IV pilus biogenesis protein CpaD/CtpE
MSRTSIALLVSMLIVAATFLGCGDSDETTTVTEPAVTRTAEPTTTTSTGTTTTGEDTTTTTGGTTTTTGEDVSGNCDEAEHANDPECQ